MQYTQQQRLAPEAPDESALYSPIPKIIDIGPALLEIFENISSVRFFRHSVDISEQKW